MMENDFQKSILLLSLLHSVPPFMQERIMHELLKSIGQKLTDNELKQLHDYMQPKTFPMGYCPQPDQNDVKIMQWFNDPEKKNRILQYIKEEEEADSE